MISAALITLNEERNLPECLESIRWADECVLIDSHSTDQTLEIAARFGAKVFQKKFINYADQKNEALSKASQKWIFFIDADERVTPELSAEILQTVKRDNGTHIYRVKRQTYFFGHRLRFSGTQDDAPIRLFPKGRVHYEQPVHEMIVSELPVLPLRAPLIHHTTRNQQEYDRKLEKYIAFELETMKNKKRKIYICDILLRPLAKFIQLYFFKFGFLDGSGGWLFARLAFYYDWTKYSRYYREMRKI